jgi:hypothetical protein
MVVRYESKIVGTKVGTKVCADRMSRRRKTPAPMGGHAVLEMRGSWHYLKIRVQFLLKRDTSYVENWGTTSIFSSTDVHSNQRSHSGSSILFVGIFTSRRLQGTHTRNAERGYSQQHPLIS